MRRTLINIVIFPAALLVRAPILSLAFAMVWLGEKLETLGRAVPGLRAKEQPRG